jgi:hypothetical protein
MTVGRTGEGAVWGSVPGLMVVVGFFLAALPVGSRRRPPATAPRTEASTQSAHSARFGVKEVLELTAVTEGRTP